jgi:hypothetical protein
MPILDRETLPPTISFKGVLYSSLLLLLVVSLFFIPELVDLQEKMTSTKKVANSLSVASSATKSFSSGEINIDEILEASKSGASLDSILSMVENSSKNKNSELTDTVSIPAGNIDSSASRSTGNVKLSVNDIPNKAILEKALLSPNVTWEQLSSNQVKQALKNAQSGAVKILKDLPARQSSVRFALINYINGISWLARSDKKIMSAEEALAYIEQLDINVTQAMISSEIEAGDFEAWKSISIGAISAQTGRAAALKQQTRIVFNPHLTISSLEISRKPDYIKSGAGWKPNKNPSSHVSIVGFVLGKDARKIAVLRNGRRISEIKLNRRPDDQGVRIFKWRNNDANGLITFRVYTKSGQAFQKHYVFINKVYQRFPQDKEGHYILPFGMSDDDVIDLQGYDQRLDRFFRVGRNSGDDSNRAFDVF